jgi:hypothetical protein
MRKMNLILVIALALSVFMGIAVLQVNSVSARGAAPVGQVVAYNPGVSITVVDQHGNQVEYELDALVKFEPAGAEKSLQVGSFVTIIAPASLDKGKQVAVGIVVHPKAPDDWKELLPSATPQLKDTPLPTSTPVTPTAKVSETGTAIGTTTATPVETLTATATPDANVKQEGKTTTTNSFIEWLKSLFQQVLSQQ